MTFKIINNYTLKKIVTKKNFNAKVGRNLVVAGYIKKSGLQLAT